MLRTILVQILRHLRLDLLQTVESIETNARVDISLYIEELFADSELCLIIGGALSVCRSGWVMGTDILWVISGCKLCYRTMAVNKNLNESVVTCD